MDATPLGPRGLGSLLDAAFRIFARHALVLVPAYALAGAPPTLLALLAGANPFVVFPAALLAVLLQLIVSLGVIRLAHAEVVGRSLDFGTALGEGMQRFWPALAVTVLLTVATATLTFGMAVGMGTLSMAMGSGAMLLFAPLALLLLSLIAIYFAFLIQVVVIERRGLSAFARSMELVRGHVLRVAAVLLLFWLLNVVVGLAFGVTWDGGDDSFFDRIVGASTQPGPAEALATLMTGAVFGPVSTLAMTLLYVDVRIRKEGYDVELLADAADAAEPAS